MGVGRRLIGLGLLLVALAACKEKEVPKTEDKPPDRLAPNEVVEGTEHAFGLPLPRVARVAARLRDSVHVTSTLTPEQLVNFVSARVKEGKTTPGSSSTVLENVIPRDDNTKRITIDIRPLRTPDGNKSEMVIRDTTPPPFEPGLTEAERYKKAGLTPEGKLLDPKTLH